MSKELLVVFDIDETLIHYMGKQYRHLFYELEPEYQERLNPIIDGDPDGEHGIIIPRPYLQELFDYYKSEPNIKIALWTYSEQEYAYHIRDKLTELLDLGDDFFLFAYGAEDMIIEETGEEDDYPKNLTKVYENFPQFNAFNTFIVDDAPGNIKHEINMKNSLLIQPFAPFGAEKVREDLGENGIEIALNDNILTDVKTISEIALNDVMGCDIEDIEAGEESIFDKKRLKRMNLSKYLKKYGKPPCLQKTNMKQQSQKMKTDMKHQLQEMKSKMESDMKRKLQEMKTRIESDMKTNIEKQQCVKWSSEYELVTIGNPKTKKNFVMTAGKKRHKSIKKKRGKKGGKKTSKKVLKRKH